MKKPDYSKKILRMLSENKALSLPDLAEKIAPKGPETPARTRYAINRSLRGLQESGLVESHFSGQNDYARLTKTGRRKAATLKLESDTAVLPNWDGQWRIVLLDLPESRKSERESLRYLLKKAGFVCLKNSAWVSPFPFDQLFINIKKDLGLSTELMVFTTKDIDAETEQSLFSIFKK